MKNLPSRELSDKLAEAISELVAARVAEELRLAERVDQSASPLGRRRHIAAVRRRLAAGEDGAGLAGRKYYLSRAALEEELSRHGRAQVEAANARDESLKELLDELGLGLK